MKNTIECRPSKYIFINGQLRGSKNPKELFVGSRLHTDILAKYYNKYLKIYVKGRLIDLGCGKVPLYEAYKPYIVENICVDWANSMNNNPFIDVKCDLTKNLPFKNDEFDTIILSDVLEHIPNPTFLFAEMHRILVHGGKIILNVPFIYWLHEKPFDFYRYTEFGLQYLAESNKFNVLLLQSIGGTLEILADIFAKHLSLISLVGPFLAIFVQNSILFFLQTKTGQKVSKKTAKLYPFGYFMVAEK